MWGGVGLHESPFLQARSKTFFGEMAGALVMVGLIARVRGAQLRA